MRKKPNTMKSRHAAASADSLPQFVNFYVQEAFDVAPLNALLQDETITDILINSVHGIYIEREGKLRRMDIEFPNDDAVLELAEDIANQIGRPLNENRPMLDARLADGSRVNIIAHPLAVDGTMISIRKFSTKKITLPAMVELGSLSKQLSEFLRICGKSHLNILISGGTGAGKTTLLNAMSHSIEMDERIVTIEDAAELQLIQPHVIRLETKPYKPGEDESDEVTIRDLVRNALRMRPDRILIGEIRGAEAFDLLQAMNTGHEGTLATVHSNHPRDALARMENMVSMAGLHIPSKAIRTQIASAVHLVVQISRMRDGTRRVTHVTEVVGMEGETLTMNELFVFNPKGEDKNGRVLGEFKWSGIVPRFIRRVAYYGELENFCKALDIDVPQL